MGKLECFRDRLGAARDVRRLSKDEQGFSQQIAEQEKALRLLGTQEGRALNMANTDARVREELLKRVDSFRHQIAQVRLDLSVLLENNHIRSGGRRWMDALHAFRLPCDQKEPTTEAA